MQQMKKCMTDWEILMDFLKKAIITISCWLNMKVGGCGKFTQQL